MTSRFHECEGCGFVEAENDPDSDGLRCTECGGYVSPYARQKWVRAEEKDA